MSKVGGGCSCTAAVNLPSLRKHTCNLSDLTAADRKRREEEERCGGWYGGEGGVG